MDANPTNLWTSPSRLAGEVAARASDQRRASILSILGEHGPQAIFEIAERLGCHDHQISGRFGELERDMLIKRTGERRIKPTTNCQCDVWALQTRDGPRLPDAAELLGYPASAKIGDDGMFQRSVIHDAEPPGIPYEAMQGLRQVIRVEIIECPGCGRFLKFIEKGKFGCGTPGCNRIWFAELVTEAGKTPVLALVMKHL